MNLKDKSWLLRDVINPLNAADVDYKILSKDESDLAFSWLSENFPIASWGRILWEKVPNSECLMWEQKWQDLPQSFNTLCDRYKLGDSKVIVGWSTAVFPAFELSLNAVRRHAVPIFEQDFDTWVMCKSENWCIEVYHEGELCFGRV